MLPKKTRPFLSKQSSKSRFISPSFADLPNQPASPRRPANEAWPREDHAPASSDGKEVVVVTNGNHDLEDKVADLSAKIAELTALITAQQGNGGEEQ